MKFIAIESIYSRELDDDEDLDLFLFLRLSLLLDLYLLAKFIKNIHFLAAFAYFYFLSSGLQPKHPQILQPELGSFVFLTF